MANKKLTKKEIQSIFEEIFMEEFTAPNSWDELTVNIREINNKTYVSISKMYEYIEVSFSKLKLISEKMGCKEVDLERYSEPGCETCDYGSRYEVTFICWG